MSGPDRVIRWPTAAAVIGVAAVVSCEDAYALVQVHGETGRTARFIPLTVDGLTWASPWSCSIQITALPPGALAIGYGDDDPRVYPWRAQLFR
jgi:hypothetical protein